MANKSATQDFVGIKDIKENIIIEPSGKMVSILLASSINFALKSLDEQQAILMQFQSFLNTLDFTLQIYVQSRRLNIEPYLATLAELEEKQDNDLMRIQLREYVEFINTFTQEVDVMSKNFFVVIPYTPGASSIKGGMTSIFGGGPGSLGADAKFEEHRLQLEQRISLVTEGLARLGVKTISLQQDELTELFYHIYNPGDKTGSAPVLET